MPSGRALVTRRSVWIIATVLAATYFLLLRPLPHSSPQASPQGGGVTGSGDYPTQAHQQLQQQRQRHQGHPLQQDVLRDAGSDAPSRGGDAWDWDWMKKTAADRVKERLGWKVGPAQGTERYTGLEHNTDRDAALDPASRARQGGDASGEDDSLSYRAHLEEEHAPHSYTTHSPTLSFDHIYVISLPRRTDRRLRMDKIARALGLSFTYVDAMSKEAPLVGWIAERVHEIRNRKRPLLAKALKVPEEQVGGMSITSIWLKADDTRIGLAFPDVRKLDERWRLAGRSAQGQAGHGELADSRVVDWVEYLESTKDLDLLRPAAATIGSTGKADVAAELLLDPIEPLAARQVNSAVIATWYSQTRAWKKIVENGDASALILEDDIDLEWDFERIWPNVERALPKDWHIVLLGHCWGTELAKPQYVHPGLHKATEPRCLHGYVVSQAGARHLLSLASDPWRAYQTPIDTLVPFLTRLTPGDDGKMPSGVSPVQSDTTGLSFLHAYSMEPAIIIQAKELSSDIQDGVGSNWRGLLADSTWDRILRDEGHEVKQLTWEDIRDDPAIRARPWYDWKKPPKQAAAPEQESSHADASGEASADDAASRAAEAAAASEEAVRLAKAQARESAMARPVDAAEREQEELLRNLPKIPAALAKGKNRPQKLKANPHRLPQADPHDTGNKGHAAEDLQAIVEALKKGGKGLRKGDSQRIGTGPKRLGSIQE